MKRWNAYSFGPASGGEPKKIVLMMHGVGSNGQDLISLAPVLAQSMPDTLFVSPDAPQHYDMAPPYAPSGYQWFSLQSRIPEFMYEEAENTYPAFSDFIDNLLKQYGLSDGDLALLGFSQGTMMALFAAMHRPRPIAGVLGYSGMLLEGEDKVPAPQQKFPICLIHGEDDDVVPIDAYRDAVGKLKNSGFDVDGLSVPGIDHTIDPSGIERGASFLQKILRAA